jgi:CelD/BcsL family acetyltransferase involved in cellulose biosynthesis
LVELMKNASEYRRHARECRELAAKMETAADREQMLAMAAHWEQLARERTEMVRKHPELAIAGEQEEGGA